MNDQLHIEFATPAEPPPLLIQPRPLWRRLVDLGLFGVFCLSLLLVWDTNIGMFDQIRTPDKFYDITGWQRVSHNIGQIVNSIIFVVVFIATLFLARRRRNVLAAAAFSAYRLTFLCAATLLIFFFAYPAPFFRCVLRSGAFIAMAALGGLILLEAGRFAALLFGLRRSWKSRAPWRDLSRPLLPVALIDVLLAGAAVYFSFKFLGTEHLFGFSNGEPNGRWLLIWGSLLGLATAAALILTAIGLCRRQTWAAWAHAILPLLVLPWGYLLDFTKRYVEYDFVEGSLNFFPIAILVWGLAGFVLGYLNSGHRLLLRRCSGCAQKEWLRVPRCPVCNDRLWVPRDRSLVALCHGCGHQTVSPTCGQCSGLGRSA